MSDLDRYWMQQCLHLARQAQGYTTPNAMVGSVVVKGSKLIGTGYHPKPGEPHAEVFALRAAGESARGATIYVNLEPCNHYGRTPPCTDALLRAGVHRVVAGMVDPNPLVAGQGIAKLRDHGIDVTVGVEEVACQKLNEAFCFGILNRRSYGILKFAMTLDGKIATRTGHSRWVSGVDSRRYLHQLRSQVDAIVVGSGTVQQDDPRLTVRDAQDQPLQRQPLRVVLSRQLDLPTQAKLWDQTVAMTWVVTGPDHDPRVREALAAQQVRVVVLPQVNPLELATFLYGAGYLTVMWECGGTLAAAAIETGAIQKVQAFIAPQLVGGSSAPTPLEGWGVETMSEALQLHSIEIQRFGSDIFLEGYLKLV